LCVCQCFSTGVLRNLRVLPVVSKGSAGLPVLSKKIKLRPTFAAPRRTFYALSRSKIYLQSGLKPCWGSLQCSPDLAGGEAARCPSSRTPPLLSAFVLEFRPFGLQESPQKDMRSMGNQNCCIGFHFTEKVEKHWCMP